MSVVEALNAWYINAHESALIDFDLDVWEKAAEKIACTSEFVRLPGLAGRSELLMEQLAKAAAVEEQVDEPFENDDELPSLEVPCVVSYNPDRCMEMWTARVSGVPSAVVIYNNHCAHNPDFRNSVYVKRFKRAQHVPKEPTALDSDVGVAAASPK